MTAAAFPTYATRWSDRPIRVCPTPWCQCPHRESGPDERCAECRRRPANSERHGSTMTKLYSEAWAGEFGCCFATWLEPEDRAQARRDYATLDALVGKLSRAELVAWLRTTGANVYTAEKTRELRTHAHIRQLALWWPRRFVR